MENVILDPLENAFDAVGAMQGPSAPLKRAAIGAALGAAIAYGLKPDFAWNKVNGKATTPKVWSATASQADKPNSTWFPVWAIIGIPAVVFSTLI